MTLSELLESDQVFVLPKDIAPVMGCNPQDIRLAARAGGLGFPVTFIGNRCKIPRIPFYGTSGRCKLFYTRGLDAV